MKKILILTIAAGLIFAGCQSKSEKKESAENAAAVDKPEETTEPSSVTSHTDEMTGKIEELKKLKPISTESLKAILPEELDGLKRTRYSVANSMGFAMGEAEYKISDESEIKVIVYDCVGEAGSAFYSMNYFMRLNMEQEDDNGYTKSVDFMGGKALEHFEKSSNDYQLTYLAGDRFLVSLDGDNTNLDRLKSLGKALDFSKVK